MEYVVDKTFEWQGRITPKVGAVMRMFGVDVNRLAEASARHHCRVELRAGQIVYITGPSGSGKSVLLRELMDICRGNPCGCPPVGAGFKSAHCIDLDSVGVGLAPARSPEGARYGSPGRSPGFSAQKEQALKGRDNVIDLNAIDLCNDRAVIDCIDGNFIDALRTLSIAGLSDVFAVLNRPAYLSEGQKYRFRLAKTLSLVGGMARSEHSERGHGAFSNQQQVPSNKQPRIIFADEFCSNLDRITAAVIAYQIRKFATWHKVAFVLASSHEDILVDLRPDVIIAKQLNGKTEVIYKYERR